MNFLFQTSKPIKRVISLFLDLIFVTVAYWAAMLVRLDTIAIFYHSPSWFLLACLLPIALIANVKLGLYRAVLRYINSKAAVSIVISVCFTTIALVFLSFFLNIDLPRTVPVIFSAFLLVLVGGSRFLMRTLIAASPININIKKKLSLMVRVLQEDNLLSLIEKSSASRLLLAMRRESKKCIARVLVKIEDLPVEILSIPGFSDLVSGKAKIDELSEVSIEDLLGRDPIRPNNDLLQANITDKVVMITGAGGSIGSELCRQILKQRPK